MKPVLDIAYVRLAAPDLDVMEAFLTDFGLRLVRRTDSALYMRGVGPEAVAHITEIGDNRHIGFALKAADRADLDEIAARYGAAVEERTEPGGGWRVTIADPDGNLVEVVHGMVAEAGDLSREPHALNPGIDRARFNRTVRNNLAPSHVLRLGHMALRTPNFQAMKAFYCDLLGMKVSDSYYAGAPDNVIAAFLHCGLGAQHVDHHTIALIGDARTGFEHMAFEVLDFDDLMMGNKYLQQQAKWRHSWGVGRHRDGSQIFDYWRDPFGNKIEHWTDGDLVNDDYPASNSAFSPELAADQLAQWGPPLTPDFMG